MASTMAMGRGTPLLTHSRPISAEPTPLIEPTERSISPSIRTQTIPSEITPTVEQSNNRLTRLFGDRKIGLRLVNTVQMMIKPTTTGSEPRSPERTRPMNSLIMPPIPAAWVTRTSLRSSWGFMGATGGRAAWLFMASVPAWSFHHGPPSGSCPRGARRHCRLRR